VATARGVNLIYQFWIHTEAIDRIGRAESTFNSPSHHRVHHGTNRQYLDRNHGGILILWDRLFATFKPEEEPVVYGLTTNIDTFDPARIASHEYVDMVRDVASSTGWSERLSFVFRGPGWAKQHRRAAA
jgi:sterol desaturase/sphingolipid hydroxylase (fatty acid hydroxylase superfamily)